MYVEDKYHYEDWEVDNGDDEVSIISIVNDFFKMETWHTSLMPLEYWVNDGASNITLYQGSDYQDCVNWIKENYLNTFQVASGDF
jgi:hypothetical protein